MWNQKNTESLGQKITRDRPNKNMSSFRTLVVLLSVFAATAKEETSSECKDSNPVYDFGLRDLRGKKNSWKEYENKILLVTNVATYWQYTKIDYPQLNAILKGQDGSQPCSFDVLGFPSNQFGLQEPGSTPEEILNGLKYVRPGNGYVPSFKLFKKGDVNGEKENPLFTHLKVGFKDYLRTFLSQSMTQKQFKYALVIFIIINI